MREKMREKGKWSGLLGERKESSQEGEKGTKLGKQQEHLSDVRLS